MALFWISEGTSADAGTETTLELMVDHPWKTRSTHEIADELEKLLPEPPLPLEVTVDGQAVVFGGGQRLTDLTPSVEMLYPSIKASVRTERLNVSDRKIGYQLEAVIGWLEKDRSPTTKFTTVETKVQIQGQSKPFPISNSIESRENRITRWSSSFDYRNGVYVDNNSYLDFLKSNVRVNLHGFHVPFNPFEKDDDSLRLNCQLDLPFFIHGLVAVRAPADLNLNAARDNVIPDAKWFELRNWMIRSILQELRGRLGKNYYVELLSLWKQRTKDVWIKQIVDNYKML
jgi:hypothetical protein